MEKKYLLLAIISLFLIASCSQEGKNSGFGDGIPAQAVQVSDPVEVPDEDPVGFDDQDPKPVEQPPLPTEIGEDGLIPPLPEIIFNEIEVTAKQWEFIPNPITVSKGDNVRLKIKSIDVDHGFALPDYGISKMLRPEETQIIEFTADKAGSFSFFCNVACGSGHRSMTGTLIVE